MRQIAIAAACLPWLTNEGRCEPPSHLEQAELDGNAVAQSVRIRTELCAFSINASASHRVRLGKVMSSAILETKAARGARPTVAITSAFVGTVGPPCEATDCMQPRKQAA